MLRALRTSTADEHRRVATTLDLLDPGLTRARLTGVLTRLHGFWAAAEAGLDVWAAREPGAAHTLGWHRRRRTALFAGDLAALGADPAASPTPPLQPVASTDEALGRLYVLEGSTLGGTFIDRHLTTLPSLARRPGAGLLPLRRGHRRHVAHLPPGHPRPRSRRRRPGRVWRPRRCTFGALLAWCAPERSADGSSALPDR